MLRVSQLEEKLSSDFPSRGLRNDEEVGSPSLAQSPSTATQHSPGENANLPIEDTRQQQLIQLQCQIQSLKANQMSLEREGEEEMQYSVRKCGRE